MVKILNKGAIPPKRIICGNCTSLLAYMPSEVFRVKNGWDYRGDYNISDVIDCPECNCYVFVENGNTIDPKDTERVTS